ncbi:NAD(P)H-quinone oxidoreductase, partial [Georgenia sp. 10Sc9-8]|nr:NAD(P)H-quinone oxidoreductase [Georgenia halotolerans]
MRAVQVDDQGELTIAEVAEPALGSDEVLVRVAAAGVNRADLLQRAGTYPPPAGASDVLGLEVSGTVEAVGAAVTGWTEGQQVCALLSGGGYAELVAVPASQLLPVPDGMDVVTAAALPEATCTVWSNLVGAAHLAPGESVLVHGGSGGVGTIAIQVARELGARVLTTAGGPDRVRRCRELGAEVGIDHRQEDFRRVVQEVTEGRGVDIVLDVIGAAYLEQNVASLATGGRLVVIGLQRGRRAELDLGRLLTKRASVHGTTLRARPRAEKAAIVAGVRQRLWPWVTAGRVGPVVHATYPVEQTAQAHTEME